MNEYVIDIPLDAPLNLSFIDKKDEKGRFMYNNGVFSEAGLHNAFEERGEGQWTGDFDKNEILSVLPESQVIEFNKDYNISDGKLVWLTPELTAELPRRRGDPIRLSDGRAVEMPQNLQNLDWQPSSGLGIRQYLIAAEYIRIPQEIWINHTIRIHIFQINLWGDPVFTHRDIIADTFINLSSGHERFFRMTEGELGSVALEDFLSSATIKCNPVTVRKYGGEGENITHTDYLYVGIDVSSYSMNSCAVFNLNNSFAIERVIKGYWMPDLNGNVYGFPIPADYVDLDRGYFPRLRDIKRNENVPLNPELARADTHRGVIHNNGLLHHTFIRADSDDLSDTGRTADLVVAWNSDGLVTAPFQTSSNFNGLFNSLPAEFEEYYRSGITAMFHGFSFERNSINLSVDESSNGISNFGGFYCVPARTSPSARLSRYGIAQYSMTNVFEAKHISKAENEVSSFTRFNYPHTVNGNLGDDHTLPIGSRFSIRHYLSSNATREDSRSWSVEGNSVRRTDNGGNTARTAYFEVTGPGASHIVWRGRQRHGWTDWRQHGNEISITASDQAINRSSTGEVNLTLDCGRLIMNYPVKEIININTSSYNLTGWRRPESGETHQGTFNLNRVRNNKAANANIMYSGDTVIPDNASTEISQEVTQSPQSLGIFDAWVFGTDNIDVYITTAAGDALWTSVNDTKVSNGRPSQIITYGDAVLLVFDKYTVYAHSTNRDGEMRPEIRMLTPRMAVASQTDNNLIELINGEYRVSHAFSGLGYRTNVLGNGGAPGTDEVQSNFQDILVENKHGNVLPPNSLTLPDGFLTQTPSYPHPVQHVNKNTLPSLIRENINAFRYSFPVSLQRGPNLDEWLTVGGNNTPAHVIDGEMTLTSDIIGAGSRLKQIVILGQLFEFDESFITPVTVESGVRIFGQHTNIFNKIFAGSSSQRGYFFDLITKSVDAFHLDSGFQTGAALDLIDAVISAIPLNEFSYTHINRLDNEKGGTKQALLYMNEFGEFVRDFGDIVPEADSQMMVGIGGLLIQDADKWRILRNAVLHEHLQDIREGNGRFGYNNFKSRVGYTGHGNNFIKPRFWEMEFYLSAAMRELYKGREGKKIKMTMGTYSLHDMKKWGQPSKEFVFTVNDFKNGYYTIRYDCLHEECRSQSMWWETEEFAHISAVTFKYVLGSQMTDR